MYTPEKESIHSGHFMVSHFEAEEQDDEDNVAVPIPETADTKTTIVPLVTVRPKNVQDSKDNEKNQQLAIDTSLTKLFQCMSLAYRQKLTSPKWNRFRGIRLRWKDKIRLNNVIWRCWHLQFLKKENTLFCQFASPLDVDTHNKPEAIVLEGKYWKRKLAAVTAEYKRWRMFYRNNLLGHLPKDPSDTLNEMDLLVWDSNSSDNMNMMVDEDYMGLMSDTLFSTITNQAFVFPDSREIAKAGLADFIQPSLGPLQPNLDDYMDTFDPLHEFMNNRLPTVPEENQASHQQPVGWGYLENSLSNANIKLETSALESPTHMSQYQLSQIQQLPVDKLVPIQDTRQQDNMIRSSFNEMLQQPVEQYISINQPYSTVISKNNSKILKSLPASRGKLQNLVYSKSMDNIYPSYSQQNVTAHIIDRICLSDTSQVAQNQPQQQQIQELHQFKMLPVAQDIKQGYRFSVPTTPNVKFTSLQPKDDKPEPRRRGAPRGRGRSRSNTREPVKKPPLLSAVSDPALLTPQSSAVLAQLLTNSKETSISSRGRSQISLFADTDSSSSSMAYSQNRSLGQSTHKLLTTQVRVKEESNTVPILPQPPPSTLILPVQASINTAQPTTSEPLLLNSYSNSNSPIMDPLSQNIHSPTSSQSSIGSPSAESCQRDRRVGHIHAEQKRRYNIKNGFDMIHSLIPHLNQNPNAKLSKAAMLQKGAEYIRQLRSERNQLKEEMETLRQQIESLNTSISNCQSMLPATGAPISRKRDSKMQEMFDDYVRNRTAENWKFWIFSLICRPLLNSFNNFVSTSSLRDLYSSTMIWVEQHCTLVDLRPVVLNSLRYLCTKTEILSDPDKLPDEARQIILGNSQNQN